MSNNVEMTEFQKIVLTGFTGTLCCKFDKFHEDVEKRIGYGVFTHQFGDKEFMEKVKGLYHDDFMAIIGESK